MPDPTNSQIAAAFDELGDLYELDGAIVHRVVAYRNAAKAVRESTVSVAAMTREGKVTQLAGIGKTLEEKINALIETGDIPSSVKLRAKYPIGLIAMTHLPGLGPKRARRLYDELGIDSLDALRAAAEDERIRSLRGFGAKAEEAILESLDALAEGDGPVRVLLDRALAIGDALVDSLRAHPASDRVELAGSARRMADTVKDLDIIATAHDPLAVAQALGDNELVDTIGRVGEAGARGMTHIGLAVDLRIVAPDQFGNLLQHFTGSKEHNMALREAAVRKGLHVSEYAVKDDATGEEHRCATEEEVYALLGLEYIPPELRENRGELEAAAKGELPDLVVESDLRGDLHCHTTLSDGRNTPVEMAEAARARGYEYLAITDHSASHGFGNDVQADALLARVEEIRTLDATLDGFRLLAGTEVNINPDGTLDYEDDVLAELDWIIASVHTSFRMSAEDMAKRICTALEHPMVDALGHPTGRMLGRRGPYAVDMDRVIETAAKTGAMLEINANPNRRDLNDVYARAASQAGIPILVDSDAHGTNTFSVARYGIATARRAWLEKKDVANTRSFEEFQKLRKKGRRKG